MLDGWNPINELLNCVLAQCGRIALKENTIKSCLFSAFLFPKAEILVIGFRSLVQGGQLATQLNRSKTEGRLPPIQALGFSCVWYRAVVARLLWFMRIWMTLRFSPLFKRRMADVWRRACGPMPLAFIRAFFKKPLTRCHTIPGEILRFRHETNNALAHSCLFVASGRF